MNFIGALFQFLGHYTYMTYRIMTVCLYTPIYYRRSERIITRIKSTIPTILYT